MTRGHLALVALPVAFNLVALRAETNIVLTPNDSTFHFNMVRWAHLEIGRGHVPLDGWFPYLSLGSSQFHHYQSLAHLLTGYVSMVTGSSVAFFWALYLLLALWPISVYVGFRLMGWDRWTAAASALISPVLVSASGYGFEHSSYTWRGLGVWAQLWGMWLLPLAWGLSWRAIRAKRSLALGALGVALVIATHFLTGYMALLSIGVWILAAPREIWRNLSRGLLVGVGALLAAAWVLVPLLVDARWAGLTQFNRGTIFADSYGAPTILGWLASGRVYDDGRLPVVSLLVLVGVVVCTRRFRHDEKARAALGVWVLSLVMWFGRATWGATVQVLPGSDDVQFQRFVSGVHLAGILLAGIGAAWLGRRLFDLARARVPALRPLPAVAGLVLVALVITAPAFSQVSAYDSRGGELILGQQAAEVTDGADLSGLIARVKRLGPGRVYAGLPSNWGRTYAIGSVPVYMVLEANDLDQVGFTLRTQSLSSDPEALFDEANPNQYDLFNIRYLLLPSERKPAVPASVIATQGRHTLWQVASTGYLEVVDTAGPPIAANRTNVGVQSLAFMESSQLAARRFPTIAFDGGTAAEPTLAAGDHPATPAGSVDEQAPHSDQGDFSGVISANRPAVVLLKATFDPRWKVTVDGIDRPPIMLAPSLVGVAVPAGRHAISFRYEPFPSYPLLLAIGLLTLALLQFGGRWLPDVIGLASRALPTLGPRKGLGTAPDALRGGADPPSADHGQSGDDRQQQPKTKRKPKQDQPQRDPKQRQG
jgi:hypothetical protein